MGRMTERTVRRQLERGVRRRKQAEVQERFRQAQRLKGLKPADEGDVLAEVERQKAVSGLRA